MFGWLLSLLGVQSGKRAAMRYRKKADKRAPARCSGEHEAGEAGEDEAGAALPDDDGTNVLLESSSPSSSTHTDRIDDLPNLPGVMAQKPPAKRERHGQAFDPASFRPGPAPGSPAAPGAPSKGPGTPGHFEKDPGIFDWLRSQIGHDEPPAAPPGPPGTPLPAPGPNEAKRVDKKAPKPWIPEAEEPQEEQGPRERLAKWLRGE